ncbi:hypothetical protein V2J09_004954 [Rumex salicifolius]
MDIVDEFNKIRQGEDLEDYVEIGLRTKIKPLVKMRRPGSLGLAFELARSHSKVVQAIVQLSKPPWRAGSSSSRVHVNGSEQRNFGKQVVAPLSVSSSDSVTKPGGAALSGASSDSREQHRVAGLCYRYGDRTPQDEDESRNPSIFLQEVESVHQEDEGVPKVYVHLITGSSPLRSVLILIDSGATHTFMDPRILKDSKFDVRQASIMEVVVVGGQKLYSNQICKNFMGEMQGHTLGGCNLVLGGDWLWDFNPILFDFKTLQISFVKKGNKVEIKGVQEEGSLKAVSERRFHKLLHKKIPMVLAQVAQLFSATESVETDACNVGIGAVLIHQGHPIAYISQTLKDANLLLSTYEKELLAARFYIKTDHQPLRHLLEQHLTTHLQRRANRKLLGLSYTISYKQGVDNKVANALSHRDDGVYSELKALSSAEPKWMQDVVALYVVDKETEQLLTSVALQTAGEYTISKGVLRFHHRIYVGNGNDLRQTVISVMHDSPIVRHSGINGTYQHLKPLFFWPKMKQSVEIFVHQFHNCYRNKSEHVHGPSLLQPLPLR